MKVDYEDISNAAFMAFSTKATSDKAKQLVVDVLQRSILGGRISGVIGLSQWC